LIRRQTQAGPVPRTLRPIFRQEVFSAGHSLNEQTLAALEASPFLIVLWRQARSRRKNRPS
jgi:hypothetical protein